MLTTAWDLALKGLASVRTPMHSQVTTVRKATPAAGEGAHKGLLARDHVLVRVHALMANHVASIGEGLWAAIEAAGVGALSSV